MSEKSQRLDEREAKLVEASDWIVKTFLLFDAPVDLAHEVAAMFVKGIRREWEGQAAPHGATEEEV